MTRSKIPDEFLEEVLEAKKRELEEKLVQAKILEANLRELQIEIRSMESELGRRKMFR